MDATMPDEIDGAKGEQVPNHVVNKGNLKFLVCKEVANPRVNELVDKGRPLKRKKVLDESTKPLTAFSCPPQKHYEWNVLPFGLKQAPSIYQRFMDNNLQGLENICLAYIDDIIVFTKGDEQEHIKAVSKVLQRIKEKGLVLSQKKSKLLQNEVEYLGLKITKDGTISLTNNTQEKLKLFPDKLEDRKQIQRFLGCLNYIAEQGFLKNLAKERKLLQKKISEKIRWEWTPADTQLVQHIKTTVQYLPELYNPEIRDFLIVETDASDDTWAGCLKAIQNGKELLGLDIDGNQIPQSQPPELALLNNEQNSVLKTEKYNAKLCKYISGTFSQAEKNYSTHEKETLACLRTLKKWKIDLLETRGRLIRWQLQLHQFHPYIKYIKTDNNTIADTLTREWKQ
ncbi:reverse transcriptase [Tanacetum coccineum]